MPRTAVPFSLLLLLLVISGVAQQVSHPGISLYRDGKNAEAIASLSEAVKAKDFKNNAELWNYLGLAQSRSGDDKSARKSLEKAVQLAPSSAVYRVNLALTYLNLLDNVKAREAVDKAIDLDPSYIDAHYARGVTNLRGGQIREAGEDAERIIAIDPASPQGFVLKSQVALQQFSERLSDGSTPEAEMKTLEESAALLKKASETCGTPVICKAVAIEAETTDAFVRFFKRPRAAPAPPPGDPTLEPLRIISKARPAYTDEARKRGVNGAITAAVLFRADGTIGGPILLNKLGYGLDENAKRAARSIRFEPEKKDGKPVSVVRKMQFTFSVY